MFELLGGRRSVATQRPGWLEKEQEAVLIVRDRVLRNPQGGKLRDKLIHPLGRLLPDLRDHFHRRRVEIIIEGHVAQHPKEARARRSLAALGVRLLPRPSPGGTGHKHRSHAKDKGSGWAILHLVNIQDSRAEVTKIG